MKKITQCKVEIWARGGATSSTIELHTPSMGNNEIPTTDYSQRDDYATINFALRQWTRSIGLPLYQLPRGQDNDGFFEAMLATGVCVKVRAHFETEESA